MAKKEKMKTPDWILEGYDSEEEYEKKKGVKKEKKSGKTFKLRRCPKCDSDEVGVVVGEEAKGKWECRKCGWKGSDIKEDELSEDEFMKYLDEKGEDIS
jgi:ribosomal protein L37AE/L43A